MMTNFINNPRIQEINEAKFSTLEKERPNALEMAKKEDEEREAQKGQGLGRFSSYW